MVARNISQTTRQRHGSIDGGGSVAVRMEPLWVEALPPWPPATRPAPSAGPPPCRPRPSPAHPRRRPPPVRPEEGSARVTGFVRSVAGDRGIELGQNRPPHRPRARREPP